MIRDCLDAYYTPHEKAEVLEHQIAFINGRQKANDAILAYIKEHPPTEGTTVHIPGAYINDAFADYNEAVTAWEAARLPVIRRYAEGKDNAQLIQDAKEILRGIRWKDIEYHPFSKRIFAKTSRTEDMLSVLTLLLTPQFQALKDRYTDDDAADEIITDAMREIFNTIFRKIDRIEDKLKQKEGAVHDEKD